MSDDEIIFDLVDDVELPGPRPILPLLEAQQSRARVARAEERASAALRNAKAPPAVHVSVSNALIRIQQRVYKQAK